jgi:hypothetical protein
MLLPVLNRIKFPVTEAAELATFAINVLPSYAEDVDDTVTMSAVVVDDEILVRPSTWNNIENN